MKYGAVITKGLQDFQILQRDESGYAKALLEGEVWHEKEGAYVLVRVVKENSGEELIKWTKTEKTSGNTWRIELSIPQGGLYRIETGVNFENEPTTEEWLINGDVRHFIGVGDLYVIAGQSNSAGYGRGVVEDEAQIGISIYKNNGKWSVASHPLNEKTDTIYRENTESSISGHSPYLQFAKILKKEINVPIGLIQSSLGGSPLTEWNPNEGGTLYRSMMRRIRDNYGKIKGVLWYQGCSDASQEDAITYFDRFNSMINAMRSELRNENLPIITAQLNKYPQHISDENDYYFCKIREIQRLCALKIKNCFIVPTLDLPLCDLIHNSPQGNMILGERMARSAIYNIYNRGFDYNPPMAYEANKTDDKELEIKFANVYKGFEIFNATPKQTAFSVYDDSGELKLMSYSFNESCIILTFDREIMGNAKVSLYDKKYSGGIVPVDLATYLPALAFFEMEVQYE